MNILLFVDFFEFAKICYPQIIVTLRYGKDVCRWLYTKSVLCYHPYFVSMLFTVLLSLHIILLNAFRTNYSNNN